MKRCSHCNVKLNADGSETYSIVTFDTDYKIDRGVLYCIKCADLIFRTSAVIEQKYFNILNGVLSKIKPIREAYKAVAQLASTRK
jgi:hypothetical protein